MELVTKTYKIITNSFFAHRSTTTNFIQPQMNGFQRNGVIPPIQTAFNLHRNDRPVPVTNINGKILVNCWHNIF